MKDSGVVITTKEGLAQIEVSCFVESCHNCSARSLCIGQNKSNGLLAVKNPLRATVGDEVEIEIPETRYNKVLILFFGILLVAALMGMGTGHFFSILFSLSPSLSSLIGLLLGIFLAGWALFRFSLKKNEPDLYPTITAIIKKGGQHG